MKSYFYPLIMLFILLFPSCNEVEDNSEYENIVINFDYIKSIDIRDSIQVNHVILEITDESLLSYIESIEFRNNKIFIYDSNRILVFDKMGHFLYTIGEKGNGPGEYTGIASFFFEDDKICLYDNNLKILLIYNEDGTYITSKKTTENISSLYPINDKQFIGRQTYQGHTIQTPTLAIVDEDLHILYNLENRYLSSGITTFDYCYSYNKNILYWEFLNDTIFTIKENKVIPGYYVDFGRNKIPPAEKRNKNISEIIEYIENSNSGFALGIRYVHEDASNIRFIFNFEGIHYARYNKETKQVSLYHFYDSENVLGLQYVMRYQDGKIILISVNDENPESNPTLLFIDE